MAATASLQSIAQSIQKGKEVASSGKIYLYGGHGNDVCDRDTKEMVIGTVPENCIYVSSAECGKYANVNLKLLRLFMSSDEKDKQLLREMFTSEEKRKEFANKIGISPDSLHIHYPGMKYVVNNFVPFTYFDDKDIKFILPSGLMEKTKMEQFVESDLHYQFVPDHIEEVSKLTTPEYPRDELFDKLKYFFDTSPAMVALLNTLIVRMIFEQTVLHKYPQEKLPLSAVVPFLNKIYNRFTREIIVNQFQASVIPTKENIERILRDKDLVASKDFVIIVEAIQYILKEPKNFNMDHNSNSPLTNTNLMANFPGIHFNFTCRGVNSECEEKTATRRLASNQNSSMVKTELSKKPNVLGDDFDYVLERVEDLMVREHKNIQAKRLAIYNSLTSIKSVVQKLNPKEQEEIIKYLQRDKILDESSSQPLPIQQKLLHLLMSNPKTSHGGTRKIKNRMNELKRIQNTLTTKQQFQIKVPKTVIPEQMIQLFGSELKNNFQAIGLKEENPAEYLKQKQKIQVKKNQATRKYNKPKRGPGSRGTTTTSSNNVLAWMKRLGW